MPPSVDDGARLGGPHPVFDLGEGLFDRIEVGRVWGQIPELGAGGPDDAAQSGRLVAAEVVQDDDVAGFEHRNELLLDIGTEALAIDRAVEDARGCELVAAQSPEEGQGAPVAVWGEAPDPLTLRSPSPQGGHIGLDPGLVDEHQAPWIEAGLPGPPALPPTGDGRTGSLKGEQRFF